MPELASRAHQQNIAGGQCSIEACRGGEGAAVGGGFHSWTGTYGVAPRRCQLFTKGFARSLGIPMVDVNHLQRACHGAFHKESDDDNSAPPFPVPLSLVSGGNSQIVKVNAYNDMEVLGQTIDDAAGEAIDKCSKVDGTRLSRRTRYRQACTTGKTLMPTSSQSRISRNGLQFQRIEDLFPL